MANPILNQMMTNNINGVVSQAKNIMQVPNNPMLQMINNMIAGKDPQQVFYAECQRKGIDPQTILSAISNK